MTADTLTVISCESFTSIVWLDVSVLWLWKYCLCLYGKDKTMLSLNEISGVMLTYTKEG